MKVKLQSAHISAPPFIVSKSLTDSGVQHDGLCAKTILFNLLPSHNISYATNVFSVLILNQTPAPASPTAI